MKKTAFALAFAAAAGFGTAAQAQDYQFELEAGYSDFENDSALDFGGTYFFDRVATAGHPLAEAAFLQRASNMSLGYITYDDSDIDSIGVRGEFYFDQLYLRGGYQTEDFNGTDVDTLSARVGWVLSEGFRIAGGLERVDVDAPGVDTRNDLVLEAKYVAKLGAGAAFNLAGSVTFVDDPIDDEVFAFEGDYYFNPAFSLGAQLSFADNDDNWGVRTRYFITPAIAGQFEYFTENDGDDDAFRLSLALRF